MSSPTPKKILHVVRSMNRGGVETWLMHLIRNSDPARLRMDILVQTEEPAAYDGELRSRGVRILRCTGPSSPVSYARKFLRVLAEFGPYDVVHSHVHHYSGYLLFLARLAGVPVRIAHSHNDLRTLTSRAALRRRAYYNVTERLVRYCSTTGLAASPWAAASLFGENWQHDSRWQILYYGIDLNPLRHRIDPAEVRRELDIPADAPVIGHVGRFDEQKNHGFLVEIAREVVAADPASVFLLVGEGPLRPAVQKAVAEAGLSDNFRFTGARQDVLRLMRGAMNLFLFPSLHEGLGLVLVEAQAAGVPCLCSEAIPPDAVVIPGLVRRLSLDSGARVWAQAVLNRPAAPDLGTSLESVLQSRFNLERCLSALTGIYAA